MAMDLIFSLVVIIFLSSLAYCTSKKSALIPTRLQSVLEVVVGGVDDFVCGILGPQGRKYTPFIGTLFLYILFMNLLGIIPFMKSPTASWSTTLALALCVFIYVQYAAIKELKLSGYIDHLMGNPRGVIAYTAVIPLFLFLMHIVGELIKPISLSLRLRSNIWGDEMLLEIVSSFGLKGLPLLFFNSLIATIKGIVQAFVFCLLATVYFAIYISTEEKKD